MTSERQRRLHALAARYVPGDRVCTRGGLALGVVRGIGVDRDGWAIVTVRMNDPAQEFGYYLPDEIQHEPDGGDRGR